VPSLQRALMALVVAAGLALLAAPTRAQTAEQILDYTVHVQIEAVGTLLVTEQIAYDFATQERHGIFRDVPVRFRYDDRHDRVYPLEVLGVWTSAHTPGGYTLEDVDNKLRIRIGDPDQTITGQHDYRIVYRVKGALNGFADHDELYWNAIGADWEVPIQQASVTVRAPAAIGQVACYAGPVGSTRSCRPSSQADGPTAAFTTSLGPKEALTVVVGFATGVVPTPRPVLKERWSMTRAFSVTPGTLGMAGGVLVVVLLVLGWLLGILGRDRRPGESSASLGGAVTEYVPPEGIRPAQAGLLRDEVVNPVAIPATVVDLAVRGYLRIEEDPTNDDWGEKPDWRLVKLKAADNDLLEYERVLLEGLFGSRGDSVQLSNLEQQFYDRSELVCSSLYEDAVQRGWFIEQPDKVHQRWVVRGRAVTVAGAVLTALAAWQTHYGLVALPILLAGLALMLGARRMPRHTPMGVELLRRVNGFRAYLQAAGVDGAGPAPPLEQFSPYLPYAMVFGLTEQWTRTLALVGAPPQTPWYRGRQPYAPDRFGSHLHRFSRSTAAVLAASPPAVSGLSGFEWGGSGSSGGGGGGFSGGGGGGGGGGSW
jgi:uncharacterized membrane protein YgcG